MTTIREWYESTQFKDSEKNLNTLYSEDCYYAALLWTAMPHERIRLRWRLRCWLERKCLVPQYGAWWKFWNRGTRGGKPTWYLSRR